ncbi:MAG: hypothetical protein IPP99_00135 [Chitinophagaceae bacterium]|nr:hypothetical protein [Chitinophagaceae bacterium]
MKQVGVKTKKSEDNYSFAEHVHRFAVWTAARAVQRNFTTTENIREAIEQTDLQNLFFRKDINSPEQFDNFHEKTCDKLITEFRKQGMVPSYGRAAKIVAIYIKTVIVIPEKGKSKLSKIAHPPIDRILLHNLDSKYPELKLKSRNWTTLNKVEYFKLIKKFREDFGDCFWKIEVNWFS